MSQITINQPLDHSKPKAVDFIRHAVASFIDMLLTLLLIPPVLSILLYANLVLPSRAFMDGLTWAVIFLLYSLIFESQSQQTLGKKSLGLRVLNEDGGISSLSQIGMRVLIKGVEMFLIAYPAFSAALAYNPDYAKIGLGWILLINFLSWFLLGGFVHDVLTGTVVTKSR